MLTSLTLLAASLVRTHLYSLDKKAFLICSVSRVPALADFPSVTDTVIVVPKVDGVTAVAGVPVTLSLQGPAFVGVLAVAGVSAD
jgi:hypothetical protein